MLSFINDGLFISQHKSISVSNTNLFCCYNIISILLMKFGLIVKHKKTKVFHFSRLQGDFNLSLLNLTLLEGSILLPKSIWWYLSFFFNQKLLFWQHIDFYANKAILTIKYMKMLGNSSRGLASLQKRHLYRCCILSIALYSF